MQLTKEQFALLLDKEQLWRKEAKEGAVSLRDYNLRAANALQAALTCVLEHKCISDEAVREIGAQEMLERSMFGHSMEGLAAEIFRRSR